VKFVSIFQFDGENVKHEVMVWSQQLRTR